MDLWLGFHRRETVAPQHQVRQRLEGPSPQLLRPQLRQCLQSHSKAWVQDLLFNSSLVGFHLRVGCLLNTPFTTSFSTWQVELVEVGA